MNPFEVSVVPLEYIDCGEVHVVGVPFHCRLLLAEGLMIWDDTLAVLVINICGALVEADPVVSTNRARELLYPGP